MEHTLRATKFGAISIVATDRDHVHVGAGTSHDYGALGLVVNSVPYRLGAHLYRTAEGRFEPKTYTDFHIRRADRILNDYPSESASKKIKAEVIATVNLWAEANPSVFEQADREHVAAQITDRNEKIAEHEAAIAELRREVSELEQRHSPMEATA